MIRLRAVKRIKWSVVGLTIVLMAFGTYQPAEAGTIVVSPVFPAPGAPISDAIAGASAGDLIKVKAGRYDENPNILGAALNGLTIRGSGCGKQPGGIPATIVDGGTAGDVFDITSTGVTLECLLIRHGTDGVDGDGADLHLKNIFTVRNSDDGVDIDANDFNIEFSRITGSHDNGIEVDGNDGRIVKNTVRNIGSDCFNLNVNRTVIDQNEAIVCKNEGMKFDDSDDNTITRNLGQTIGDECIDMDGSDNNLIARNTCIDVQEGLVVDGDDNILELNDIYRVTRDDGIDVRGDDNIIRENSVRFAADDCYQVDTPAGPGDATVVDNTAQQCFDEGFDVTQGGTGTGDILVEGNTAEGCQRECYDIDATGTSSTGSLTVRNNSAKGCDDECYDIDTSTSGTATTLTVEGNTCEGAADECYEIRGMNPVVLDNTGAFADDEVFDIDCSTSCGAGRFEGNSATGSGDFDEGVNIFISSCGAPCEGFTVANNRADHNIEDGFNLNMDGASIHHNTATGNGGDNGDAGFVIIGDRNVITNNESNENKDDGFNISGDGNMLDGNLAKLNMEDGFHIVSGTGNELDNNTALDNHAEGFENDGTLTVFTNNNASGNRTDCANDGTISGAVPGSNTCADGSDFGVGGEID